MKVLERNALKNLMGGVQQGGGGAAGKMECAKNGTALTCSNFPTACPNSPLTWCKDHCDVASDSGLCSGYLTGVSL